MTTSKNPQHTVLKEGKPMVQSLEGSFYYLLASFEMCNMESSTGCKSLITHAALYSLGNTRDRRLQH